MGLESIRGGPKGPERSLSRELIRRNSALFLNTRGVDFQRVIQAGQNVQIELAFDRSSERGIPPSVNKFLSRRYKDVDTTLSAIRVCFEYMSASNKGVMDEGYLNQIQLFARNKNGNGTLQDQSSTGIIVPHDESVRSSVISLLPDMSPPQWRMSKISMRQAINPDPRILPQKIGGILDERVLTDIALLIPDAEPSQQEIRRPLSSASELLRLGYDTIIRTWNPESAGPIAPPVKSILVQSPTYR